MEPAVSFCIRGWRAATLPRAIESALAQTIQDVEVVVTDDRGDLEEVVEAVGDPRIRYFRNPVRLGPSWNARESLNRARGKFLGQLNDDDRLLPTFAETVLERFERVPRAGLVFTNLRFERGDASWVRRSPVPDGTYESFLVELLGGATSVAAGTALIRREVWEQGERDHPIPNDTASDAFIALRAAASGVVFSYIDIPLLVWSLHDDSLSGVTYKNLQRSLFSSFRFDDPVAENLRLSGLSAVYVGRAVQLLKIGRAAEARSDLETARELGRRARGPTLLARLPVLVRPVLGFAQLVNNTVFLVVARMPILTGPVVRAQRLTRRLVRRVLLS